ncbi:hypothetical protein [Vitiosangium sp. GDMCC 1.1324]|uniref:hypothetical protein n=1 Tax=Vitiosangium sp. (strain GDMCC 1.1324) TaxID=2138576 RepID=UPI000D38A762|nr:hypothetical protein [Vitiosangium sp. GDMCC 1.1324]PTL84566.1 hypothetical protein DAT35_05685 [Vitiosangium sp. GDMCC 1.1324]
MKIQRVSLVLAVSLLGCGYLGSRLPFQTPSEDDESIAFPEFFEHVAVKVGAKGEPYELDGEMLRALVIASNDYLPSDDRDLPCPSRKEAYVYRVIRQGSIIFVLINWNYAYCGYQYPPGLGEGMMYAISADGRILRRLVEGTPSGPIEPETPDAGRRRIKAEPGVSSEFEAMWNSRRDGGTAPTLPLFPPALLPAKDGGSAVPDGGSSGADAG